VVVVHAAFVVFVVVGGLLVARWPRMAWLHLPAVAWGVAIELLGWMCPLTPLENGLRERAGSSAYQGDFIEHYVVPVLYPAQLTRARQIRFAVLAIVVNVCVYAYSIRRARRSNPS
jgi:hypothetical protein